MMREKLFISSMTLTGSWVACISTPNAIPKMVQKGFLLIEDKTVHSYWLDI